MVGEFVALDNDKNNGFFQVSSRGGAGRGQGRKAIAHTGELMKARPVRMTEEQWQKCKALGGAAWVRRMIDEAATPNPPAKRAPKASA